MRHCSTNDNDFKYTFKTVLTKYAPKKKKVIRHNHELSFEKKLKKAIMLRSRLKNKATKTKSYVDIAAYKKQWNYVVVLSQKSKYNYFNNLDIS